jgi:hypothetical protein
MEFQFSAPVACLHVSYARMGPLRSRMEWKFSNIHPVRALHWLDERVREPHKSTKDSVWICFCVSAVGQAPTEVKLSSDRDMHPVCTSTCRDEVTAAAYWFSRLLQARHRCTNRGLNAWRGQDVHRRLLQRTLGCLGCFNRQNGVERGRCITRPIEKKRQSNK